MYKKLYTLFAVIFISYGLHAVPAYPFPIEIEQPDGTILTIQLHGDESFKLRTTLDGYVISENQDGFYTYSVFNDNKVLVAGDVIARDADKRTLSDRKYLQQALKKENIIEIQQSSSRPSKIKHAPQDIQSTSFPTIGSPRSLVILVNFADKDFVIPNPQQKFTRLLNQENYNEESATGSARDYFRASSYGHFSPHFDVVGPYTLPKNMDYYGANDSDGDDKFPVDMIMDACLLAYNDGVDFSEYDTDDDGYVDNVFVYYAGHNEAEGASANTVWPHRWVVYPGYNYKGDISPYFNGVKVFDYACTSELRGRSGSNICGIGTFCHEFGHVLGLPDYYHTTANKATLDYWSIMDAGSYSNSGKTPPLASAFDRFYLGWLIPEELKLPVEKELLPLSQNKNEGQSTEKQAYLLSEISHNLQGNNPDPKEFFIMEYRKKTGWDAYLPAEGLLFWHIDYDANVWTNNTVNNYSGSGQTASSHMRVYLEHPTQAGKTPGSAFTSGSFTAKNWQGEEINRKITNINKTSDKITFNLEVEIDESTAPRLLAGVITEKLNFGKTKPFEMNVKYLRLSSRDVTNDLNIEISGEDADVFTLSNNSISRENVTRQAGAEIYIIFRPLQEGEFNAVLSISGGGMVSPTEIELKAVSE